MRGEMIEKLTDWILNREPVRAATGVAGLLIAALGVVHEFDVLETLTVSQVTAIGTFLSVVAGWLARKKVSPVGKGAGG